jgi:hypothetical protein
MTDIDLLINKYDPKDYSVDYSHGQPIPWITFDDFLPKHILQNIQEEINTIPKHLWGKFTRNGSYMLECNNLKFSPKIRQLVLELNSGEFLKWLESVTGLEKLIPDPHLIGAGLMRCYAGHNLKLHTDFNWNEELHLNRALSLIIYFSKDWKPEWNGALEFWNFDKTQCLHKIDPLPNRMLLWDYNNKFVHGHPAPLICPDGISRDGLRLFYFTSNSTPSYPPHRSLYWFDEQKGPYDRRENK